MAKIKKGDPVQVIIGRTSNSKRIEERNACRAEFGLNPTEPGDRGEQSVVLSILGGRVIVEGINRVKKHVKTSQNQRGGSAGDVRTIEAPIHISKVALAGPDKKPIRVGHREVEVKRDGRTKIMRERIGRRDGEEIEL